MPLNSAAGDAKWRPRPTPGAACPTMPRAMQGHVAWPAPTQQCPGRCKVGVDVARTQLDGSVAGVGGFSKHESGPMLDSMRVRTRSEPPRYRFVSPRAMMGRNQTPRRSRAGPSSLCPTLRPRPGTHRIGARIGRDGREIGAARRTAPRGDRANGSRPVDQPTRWLDEPRGDSDGSATRAPRSPQPAAHDSPRPPQAPRRPRPAPPPPAAGPAPRCPAPRRPRPAPPPPRAAPAPRRPRPAARPAPWLL
jgi:hypothetical protein